MDPVQAGEKTGTGEDARGHARPSPGARSVSSPDEEVDPPAVVGVGLQAEAAGDPGASTTRGKIERLGRHAWSIVGIGLAALLVVLLLRRLSWLVAPAVAVVVLGVLAAPLVQKLVRQHVHRTLATALVYLFMVAVLVGFGWLVGPAFVSQVGKLAIDVPNVADQLSGRLDRLEEQMADVSDAASEAIGRFKTSVAERSEDLGQSLADGIVGLFGSALGIATALVIGLVISFLVVKDLPRLTANANQWMERPENARRRGAIRSVSRSTTGYIRGQLLDAVIVGVLKTFAMWLLGLPYFVPLGVLSGVANLVPGVGPVVAAIPPVLIAYSLGGWDWALLTLFALGAVQLADYYWFAPSIVGEVNRLPTLVVIVALIVGAGTAGLLGLIVAVPVAMAIRDGLHWGLLPEEQVEEELEKLEAGGAKRRRAARGRGRPSRRRRAEAEAADGDRDARSPV